MDIFDNYYFHLNKKLLIICGLWPEHSQKKITRAIWLTILFVSNIPQAISIAINISDLDKIMENWCVSAVLIACFLKLLTLAIAEKQMIALYNGIANNWLSITDEEERKILMHYSQKGRNFTIIYAPLVLFCGIAFVILPGTIEILNLIDPLPEPRPHIYMLQGEYFIENKDDHFGKIWISDIVSASAMLLVCMTVDPVYTASVEHSNALYAIVTYRLSKLRSMIGSESQHMHDASYEWLIHTVKLHQTVENFTKNLADSFSNCFFGLAILNIATIPVSVVLVLAHWGNPINFFRHGVLLSGLMMHLFVIFWPGQKLLDHSTRLIRDAYNNQWYETPEPTKKILHLLMLRNAQPAMLTAGGLIVMNFENYLMVVKTAASYITVILSLR